MDVLKKSGEVRPLDCHPLLDAGLPKAGGFRLTEAWPRLWWAPAQDVEAAPASAEEPSPRPASSASSDAQAYSSGEDSAEAPGPSPIRAIGVMESIGRYHRGETAPDDPPP